MQSVAEEMKKVYEGGPEINPDGSLRSLNLPGLFDMLKRGEMPYLVDLVSAMITTPHRAKEDARLSRANGLRYQRLDFHAAGAKGAASACTVG